MNTFSWLLLGHLVGDWLLQSDWMARGKKQNLFSLAGLAHVTVYTFVITTALWLAEGSKLAPILYSSLILLIFTSHWLIDTTLLVEGWMHFFGQSRELVRLMIDQTLHLLVLALLIVILAV